MHPILHNSYYFYKYIFIGAPHFGPAGHKTGEIVVFRSNQGPGMLCMPVFVMSRMRERTVGAPWIFQNPLIIPVCL
jgi:hypothetical protein